MYRMKGILDTANKEHKQAAFLAINPRGQMPALEDVYLTLVGGTRS